MPQNAHRIGIAKKHAPFDSEAERCGITLTSLEIRNVFSTFAKTHCAGISASFADNSAIRSWLRVTLALRVIARSLRSLTLT